MIKPEKIKRSEAIHIIELVEQQTRAEILSRFGRFDNLEFADYFGNKLEKEDELRKYIFGSSNLITLGTRWGILPEQLPKRRKRKRRDNMGEKESQMKYTKVVQDLMKVRRHLLDYDAKQVKIFAERIKIGTFFSDRHKAIIQNIYSRYKREKEKRR